MPKKKIQDPNPYHGTGFYDFQNIVFYYKNNGWLRGNQKPFA
jgi:hypothetical protein